MISLVFLSSVTAHGRRRASQFHNKQGNYLQSAPSFWGIKLRRDDKIPPEQGFFIFRRRSSRFCAGRGESVGGGQG